MQYVSPLPELFERSRLMYLDFSEIPADTPDAENIRLFFEVSQEGGVNPRLPQNRQTFNNDFLQSSGARYLVSRYGEDRIAMLAGSRIASEGRTLHMGIDIFSKDLEPVFAPCDGEIVRAGFEEESHGYGHYLLIKPAHGGPYIFLGHLSSHLPQLGPVTAGQQIAQLGDYHHGENGGWSRHLHLQLVTDLPPEGKTPNGYSTKETFAKNSQKWPDPFLLYPNWRLR